LDKRTSGRTSRRRPQVSAGFPTWLIVLIGALVVLGMVAALVYPRYQRAATIRGLLSENEAARKRACAKALRVGRGIVSEVVSAARQNTPPSAADDLIVTLLRLVESKDDSVRQHLRTKLKDLVADWADDAAAEKRRAAARVLSKYFKSPDHTVDDGTKDALLKLVDDRDRDVRMAVVSGIDRNAKSAEAVEVVCAAMDDEDFEVRLKAREVLPDIICKQAAWFLLKKARETKEPSLKAKYVHQVGNYTGDPIPLEALVPFMEHESSEVRAEAVLAIGYGGPGEAERLVVKALDDPSAEVRAEAARQIRLFRMKDLGGPAVAGKVYNEPVKKAKIQMIMVIYHLKANYAAITLARIAANEREDKEVRLKALEGIAKMYFRTPEESLPLAAGLIHAMESADAQVAERARAAAASLASSPVPSTIPEWKKWYADRQKELELLKYISDLMDQGGKAERAGDHSKAQTERDRYFTQAEKLYRSAQTEYDKVLEVCNPRDRDRYEKRQRQISKDIRRVMQKVGLVGDERL
jgi:hypothetical protein